MVRDVRNLDDMFVGPAEDPPVDLLQGFVPHLPGFGSSTAPEAQPNQQHTGQPPATKVASNGNNPGKISDLRATMECCTF